MPVVVGGLYNSFYQWQARCTLGRPKERVRKDLPNDKNTVKSEICWYDEITKEKSRLATKIIVLIVFNTYFPTDIQVFFRQHLEF